MESRNASTRLTWRNVLWRRGGVPTKIASTTVEAADLDDIPESLLLSAPVAASVFALSGAVKLLERSGES
jgi:hypothetical protein